jgi:hypothetical protein
LPAEVAAQRALQLLAVVAEPGGCPRARLQSRLSGLPGPWTFLRPGRGWPAGLVAAGRCQCARGRLRHGRASATPWLPGPPM